MVSQAGLFSIRTDGRPVLNNPLDIYRAATTFFSCPRIVIEQQDPVEISLMLDPQVPVVRITSAVSRILFLSTIQELVLAKAIANRKGVPFAPSPLDPSRFSIQGPLTNWQQFQRFWYEQRKRKCEDVLRNYLQSPLAKPVSDQLTALGFSPDQVETHVTEEEVRYFSQAIRDFAPTDPAIANLRARYPRMTRFLAEANARRELEQPREDPFANILARLQSQVIGQELATRLIAGVLSQLRADDNSVFLFIGPSGVGKTELAKAAAILKNNQLVTFDMEQFRTSQDVCTFFGSPSGHVGSVSKPHMASALEKFPDAVTRDNASNVTIRNLVILFDELEKAHADLRQSLITLFDEGRCTVRYTLEQQVGSARQEENVTINYHLKGCIIISTSNLCQEPVLRAFQRGCTVEEIENVFKIENRNLQQTFQTSFSNELLCRNRMVPFGPVLRGEPYQLLLRNKLNPFLLKMREELGCREFEVEGMPSFLRILEERLYGEGVDIRRVKRYFDDVRNLIYENKSHWGDLRIKKITLSAESEHRLQIRLATFDTLMGGYVPTPASPVIF